MTLSKQPITPKCGNPECSELLSIPLGDVRDGLEVTCSACGATTALKIADGGNPGKAVKDLEAALGKFGKRTV